MTDEELLLLYAKDRVVLMYGMMLLSFSKEAWEKTVEGVLRNMDDEALNDMIPKIRKQYFES
jgi:hypothetical protein